MNKILDCVDYWNRYYTKEQREKYEKDTLFKNRYKKTFDAIGDKDYINKYNTYKDENN